MPDDPQEDVITSHKIKANLQALFPRAKTERSLPIGGERYWLKIWEFNLTVSLITDKMTHQDVVGVAILVLTGPSGASKAIQPNMTVRKKLTTSSMEELFQGIEWCRAYLMGIAAHITRACEVSLSSPLAPSILDSE